MPSFCGLCGTKLVPRPCHMRPKFEKNISSHSGNGVSASFKDPQNEVSWEQKTQHDRMSQGATAPWESVLFACMVATCNHWWFRRCVVHRWYR